MKKVVNNKSTRGGGSTLSFKNSERNSSIELLRIICILLIIAHHYFVHGGFEKFSYASIGCNTIFLQILSMFGRCSCSIFALITGYYLINSKRENHYKKIFPLIGEMYFYSILIWIIFYSFKLVPISKMDTLKSIFPIFFGNWYVVYYLLFYLFIPFINSWLNSMNKKDYTILLITILIVWSIIPTFTANAWKFGDFDFFIVMYIIGAYIKLHINKKFKFSFLLSIISTALLIFSVICLNALGNILNSNIFITNATYFKNYNSILSVMWAISTFMYFLNLNIKSKFVNLISGSVLGIYLIHDNSLMNIYIWQKVFPNIDYVNTPYIHAFVKILAVFVICLIIDLFRKYTVGKVFDDWIAKKYGKICLFLRNVKTLLINRFY